MKWKNVSLRSRSTVFTSLLVFAFTLSSIPAAFGQNWYTTSDSAPEGGNWTDPSIWLKQVDAGTGEEIFPDDDYPGQVTEGSEGEPVWVELRHGLDNPVVIDQEIAFTGNLDAPEGGIAPWVPGGTTAPAAHLVITETGSLTVNNTWDFPYRFALGDLTALVDIDGGSIFGPNAITWIGSWGGTAEVNIMNGGLLDVNYTQMGSFGANPVASINIHDGTYATNRILMGQNGTGVVNLFGGEMQVRGPINGEDPTFTLGGGGNIHLVDGLLRASTGSLADGLTGDNIAGWIENGNITAEWSSVDREMAYTGWEGMVRWNESAEEVVAWAVSEPAMFEGPVDQFSRAGETVEFSVSAEVPASGGTLSYQWQHDGTDIAGATAATLSLENVTAADTGEYTVVVTEDLGDLGESTVSASASLLVVDTDAPALLSVDMQGGGAPMSGHGRLRTTGLEPFVAPNGDDNPMEIGEGDTVWNGLAASSGTTTYTGLVDSRGLSLTGVNFTVTDATGSGDEQLGGGIDAPIEEWSGPLLRDFVHTTGDDEMSLRLGGLDAFAGLDITLVVYALGPQSTFDEEHERDDIATVRLASANNPMGLDPVVTDTAAEGRDLRYNNRAFAVFDGRVSASGTVNWTIGPVPGTPGFNAMNGFQILITNQGEPLENTPIEEWRMTHFGTTENSGMAADDADYDGDGIKNRIEYSVGSDPTVNGDAAAHLTIGTTAVALADSFQDKFAYSHDFVADGVGDTGWDRITGTQDATGERIEAQNGLLHMTSSDTTGDVNPLTIARSVPRGVNLQATVQLLDAPATADEFFERDFVDFVAPQLYIGRSDNPDGVSHYISAHFFDAFGLGNGMQVVEDFTRTFDGAFTDSPGYPWMRIEFIAETGQVTAFRSVDGEEWEEYASQTLPALTAGDAELEIGLLHTTWSAANPDDAFVEWGNFEIRDLLDDGSGKTELDFLSLEFDYVGDPAFSYVIQDSANLNEGWNDLQVFGPFADPGTLLFIDSEPIGADPTRFLRLHVRPE